MAPLSWRRRVGVAFLLFQVGMVVQSRFLETRSFCWAPHTTQVRYEIAAFVNGRALHAEEIQGRYRVPASGWEAHSAANLLLLVEQYEKTYAGDAPACVEIRYTINGTEPRVWRWPGA